MITDENVVHCLWALAEEALHSYNFKEAIYFLESICNSSLRMIPQMEVRTRLRLAEILLKHTDDVESAKEHLDHALSHEPELILHILYFLSIVHEKKGQTKIEKQYLKRGTEFPEFPKWYQFFCLELARVECQEDDHKAALDMLRLGLQSAEQAKDLSAQILFKLSIGQEYLRVNDFHNSSSLLDMVELNLAELENDTHSGEQEIAILNIHSPIKMSPQEKIQISKNHNLMMLQIHHLVLCLSYMITQGSFQTASKKLDKLLELVNSLNDQNCQNAILYSTTYFLSVICHRPIGNLQTSIGFCSKGIQLINSITNRELVNGTGVPLAKKNHITSLLKHKLLLLENSIYLHLTSAKIAEALHDINEMSNLYETFPEIFKNNMMINFVLGLYAQTIGVSDYAIAHYNKALSLTNDFDQRATILIYLAITYLNANAIHQVVSIVNTYSKLLSQHSNRVLKAGILLVHGLLLYKQEDITQSREKIKDCLSVANGSLSHNQIAATTLNLLGAYFLGEDNYSTHTSTLLRSALVLSYRSEDYYPKLYALELLAVLYEKNSDHINQTHNLSYKISLERERNKSIEDANNSPYSTHLLTKYLDITSS